MGRVWAVLRVENGREADVAPVTPLPVYFPKIRKFNRRNRTWMKEGTPMFPGYVFVQTEDPPRFPHSFIWGWLRTPPPAFAPTLLPEEVIEEVRRVEQAENRKGKTVPSHGFMVDDMVRFCSGHFSGFQGVISAILNDLRVRVDTPKFPVNVHVAELEFL